MKKVICAILLLAIFAGTSVAEDGFDLSGMTPAELQVLIEAAEVQLSFEEDGMVRSAVELLKQSWKADYEKSGMSPNGYLEILHTRVSYIRKDFATQDFSKNASASMFENVYCVIDFVLLTDQGSAPYYVDQGYRNQVVVLRNGEMQLASQSIFRLYTGRTYNFDLSGIIETVRSLGGQYNAVYELLNE